MTEPPWPDTLIKTNTKSVRHCALSSTLPFMSPHLATASLHPASPHQIEAPWQTHIHLIAEGGLTQPKCTSASLFLLRFPSIPAPCRSSVSAWQSRQWVPFFFTVNGWRDTYFPLHTTSFACIAKGYSGVIDVLVGVVTQEVWLNHFEKVCVGVGSHNISNLWSFRREDAEKLFYLLPTQGCTTSLPNVSKCWLFERQLV